METVTIAASRGFTVADMEMLVGSAVIVAVLGWMVFSASRFLRNDVIIVGIILLGVIGMLVVAFSVARMVAEDRRSRGPVTVSRVPQAAPQSPRTPQHA